MLVHDDYELSPSFPVLSLFQLLNDLFSDISPASIQCHAFTSSRST